MSEESELEKTEQASESRLEKAREEGNVPRSKELATCALLLAAGLGLWILGGQIQQVLREIFSSSLAFERAAAFDISLPFNLLVEQLINLLFALAPWLLLLIIVAFASHILIGGWNFSTTALIPNFGKLNPMKGLGNIISTNGMIELVKAILKTVVIGFVAYLVIKGDFDAFVNLSLLPVESGVSQTKSFLLRCFMFTTGALVFIAAIDVPYQLYHYAEQMKMSTEEVKQESKESNGNPEIKGRIRQQQREMARRRMMSQIPQADVVIVNPTHYAVAIQYAEDSMRAPKLVAKGTDAVALRIREIASENKVMTLESPKLARALYAHTELEEEIPEALYMAVAEILAYVFQVKSYDPRQGNYPTEPTDIVVPDELDPHATNQQPKAAA